jgi:hypothetical protein
MALFAGGLGMNVKLGIGLFLLIAIGSPVHAQSPCSECLRATQEELKKCLDNAISQEDKNSCEDKQKEGVRVCQNGKCKIEREMKDNSREVLPEKK